MRVALGWLWGGSVVPSRWLCGGLGVALRSLCTPESMPSICLVYGLGVALGGLRRLTSISAFYFCWSVALGGLCSISDFYFLLSAFAGVDVEQIGRAVVRITVDR